MTSWIKDRDLLNKFLFVPPTPTYNKSSFDRKLIWLGAKGNRFPVATTFPRSETVRWVFLYCHGNGCDLGGVYPLMSMLRDRLKVGVVAPEYPGYGLSEGSLKPSETSINACVWATYQFIRTILKVPAKRIILFGTSIGSGPTCSLASKLAKQSTHVGGIILQCPFTSIKELVSKIDIFDSKTANFFAQTASYVIADRFENLRNLEKVPYPLLVMHGQNDDLIPSTHSKSLFDASKAEVKQLCVFPDADHNIFDWTLVIAKINSFTTKLSRLYKYDSKISVSANGPTISELQIVPDDIEATAASRHDVSKASGLFSTIGGTLASTIGTPFGIAQSVYRSAVPFESKDDSPINIGPSSSPTERSSRSKSEADIMTTSKPGKTSYLSWLTKKSSSDTRNYRENKSKRHSITKMSAEEFVKVDHPDREEKSDW